MRKLLGPSEAPVLMQRKRAYFNHRSGKVVSQNLNIRVNTGQKAVPVGAGILTPVQKKQVSKFMKKLGRDIRNGVSSEQISQKVAKFMKRR